MPKLKFMLFSDIRTKTNQIHIIKIMVPHEFVGKKIYCLDGQVCLRFGVVDPHLIKFFVLLTLFLSKKWSTTPNFSIKFGDVVHFIGNKRVGNTKFNHVGSSALAKWPTFLPSKSFNL